MGWRSLCSAIIRVASQAICLIIIGDQSISRETRHWGLLFLPFLPQFAVGEEERRGYLPSVKVHTTMLRFFWPGEADLPLSGSCQQVSSYPLGRHSEPPRSALTTVPTRVWPPQCMLCLPHAPWESKVQYGIRNTTLTS
ncbi:hypothetical protein F4861DRAFT_166352 [Xylaria intraflava]|nr:hypothetical protein F4861DRAFT_166352 [Xylaria intraflava]